MIINFLELAATWYFIFDMKMMRTKAFLLKERYWFEG